MLELLQSVTGMDSAFLAQVDHAAGTQTVTFTHNRGALQIPEGLRLPWPAVSCQDAAGSAAAMEHEEARTTGLENLGAMGVQTCVSASVNVPQQPTYGTLMAASAEECDVVDNVQRVVSMFAHLIGQFIERDRLVRQLSEANTRLAASALTDEVTGLPNRRHFEMELSRMLARANRDSTAVMVAFIDLDGFKQVNDTYGHEVGDRLLEQIGQRIENCARAGDIAARYGGDEFIVAAPVRRSDLAVALSALRDRLTRCTAGQYELGEATIDYVGSSVGVSVSSGKQADMESLIRAADEAMYEAKRFRKSQLAA